MGHENESVEMINANGAALPPAKTTTPTEKNNVDDSKVELKRSIGLMGGSGLIVGCIIGSGIFITPTAILDESGSIGVALTMWIISGILSILGGLCFAELGTTIPESGAEYNYILEGFGSVLAFLFIWTCVFVIKPASVTIIAITSSTYISEAFFPDCVVPEIIYKLLAAVIIVSITLLNMISVKWSIRINNVLMYTKFIAIIMFVVIGLTNLRNAEARSYFANPFEGSKFSAGSIGTAFFQALWAYDGFNNLNYAAEEMVDPDKNLPRSIIVGMILVTVSYLAINFCYIAAIGPHGILESKAVGLTIGYKFLGKFSFFVPILVACCTFGSAVSTIFGNGRLLFVAGRSGHLPLILSSIQRTLHTPIPSLAFTAIISLLLLIPSVDKLDQMINLFSFATWFFFLLCFLAQIYLRYKRPEMRRPFKVWIIVPIIMCISSAILIILPIFQDAVGFLIALTVILAGLPVYVLFVSHRHKLPTGMFTFFDKISNFLMVVYDLQVAENEEDMG